MVTIQDAVSYYVQRMASIYRSQPKASAMVALFTKKMLADLLAVQLNAAYDLSQAVGVQLDMIGKYVGVSRDVGTINYRPYFGFVTDTYPAGDQNLNGFTDSYSLATNASGVWLRDEMSNQSTSQLSDFQYQQLLRLKIVTNSSDNTMASIQDQIANFYAGQLQLRDNQDMTMTYFYGSSFQLPTTVLSGNLPRPMGVGVVALPAIGFDVSIDGVPTFTSQIPGAVVNFGTIDFSKTETFQLTNATESPFTIVGILSNNSVFTIGLISSIPDTLNNGDSFDFQITASSSQTTATSAIITIYLSSLIGISEYKFQVTVDVTGVYLVWMAFDNFDEYADGLLPMPNDSWGWSASGTTIYYPN